MRMSSCQRCGQWVYFENVSCVRCGAVLGFVPDLLNVVAFEPIGGSESRFRRIGAEPEQPAYRPCANHAYVGCNWMLREDEPEHFCRACRLNRTIPDLAEPGNIALWQTLETEKRRLIYSLLRLGLPVLSKSECTTGLAFDFLANDVRYFNERGPVSVGHADGVITLDIAEADPATRERLRSQLAEPYRTILGHFRHESGHYYWDRLVRDTPWQEPVRAMFGDDRFDYATALRIYYENGPPDFWRELFVSAYASAHAWEDWAETWTHYLHIVDTLETAQQFGLRLNPQLPTGETAEVELAFDPYETDDFDQIIAHWLPLTYALNSLNRSMGHEHAYPFVLARPVIDKLALVHRIVRAHDSPPVTWSSFA